jgi:hypothetical protein
MLKKAALGIASIALLAIPTIASARDRDDYRYGRDFYDRGRHENHEWREREREHERHEWREHEWREHEWRERRWFNNNYYNGSYNGGYYNPNYGAPAGNGYYDSYGYWHPYGR